MTSSCPSNGFVNLIIESFPYDEKSAKSRLVRSGATRRQLPPRCPNQQGEPVLKRIRATREDGFTLTELLIVIVVLGILAGIVVFAVNQFSDDSNLTACKADKKTVEIAVEAYKGQKGTIPSMADLANGYIKAIPSNKNYKIVISATGDVTSQEATTTNQYKTC
jgi:prepilin-type N-terminal cleavage/methylation domain-containing protein